jgi:hypothetical protein
MNDRWENQDALRENDTGPIRRLAPPDIHDPVIEAYKKDVDRNPHSREHPKDR